MYSDCKWKNKTVYIHIYDIHGYLYKNMMDSSRKAIRNNKIVFSKVVVKKLT